MRDFYAENYGTIQEAVSACGEAGGGRVIIRAGEWKTGPIHFRSNVELHMEEGAVVEFSDRFEDYLPVVFTRHEGKECYNYSPLIYADGCEHIAITGKGTLIGNGQKWWPWFKLQKAASKELTDAEYNGIPVEQRVYGTEEAALRTSFIQPVRCKDVFLEDFTIKDGPMWTIHPVYCEDVTVRNVNVSTHGPNTDGCNPDSCRNVLIEGCTFDTGDDCIAINSGLNEDGWRVGRPCENIEIRNCVMNGGHGAVVIGSGMSGGVRNVYAHDCKINGTMWGIRLKSINGRGGYVENVRCENMEINNVTEQAIQITMFYEYSKPGRTYALSDFHDIEIRNISGKGAKVGILMKGFPEHRLRNVVLENIDLTAENACVWSDIENLSLSNVTVHKQEEAVE